MLALTSAPLRSAGERAVFGELSQWARGSANRPGVLISLPMADGPMGRRTCDAVLFVPEGLTVVRIVEVPKQRGVVTVVPEGAWSIAPTPGPGEVLQLLGGGSTPLDGLMRAGMSAAVRLRAAGIEPGRIARLTVLVGELTGLDPADGDLGGGDHVALANSDSLLLGIARSAQYAGVDNPRLWTTADVRTALTALELQGRGPSIEELNSEGFPYSPYVLRKPELLTPASVNAASSAAPPRAPRVAQPEAPSGGPAGAPAAPSAAPPSAAPAGPVSPPTAPAWTPAAASAWGEQDPGRRPDAFVGSATATVAQPAAPGHAETAGDGETGLGGLFGGAEYTDPAGPERPRTLIAPAQGPPDRYSAAPLVVARRRPERSRRIVFMALAAAFLLAVVVVGVVLGTRGDDGPAADTDPTPTSATPTAPAGATVGDQTALSGVTFTLQAIDSKSSCQGHAYGELSDFFVATDCTGLERALYSADVDGNPAVVAVSHVAMSDTPGADALQTLADTDGKGNVNDLFLEGARYEGGPTKLADARQYDSTVKGNVVIIVETAWVGSTAGTEGTLDDLATTALALELPDPSAG